MKLLVGRQYYDDNVQAELKKLPYTTVPLPHGGIGVELMYDKEQLVVSIEHLMAMMLSECKKILLKATNNNLTEVVLAVPFGFTESQRKGVISACNIADIPCAHLITESAAIALSYGIHKSALKIFSTDIPTNVLFVDIGHTTTTVSMVAFIQEKLTVLATEQDACLGGRDLDEIIVSYCCDHFFEKTGIDVKKLKKPLLKLKVSIVLILLYFDVHSERM